MEKMKEMRFMGMQRAFETILQTGRNNDLTGDELVS
jgi:hypothetical protein